MDLVQGCLPVVEGELTNILKVLHKKGNNFFKAPFSWSFWCGMML